MCPSTFTRKWNLKQHMQFECGDKFPQFQCELCDFRTKYKRNVKSHYAHVHSILMPGDSNMTYNNPQERPGDELR